MKGFMNAFGKKAFGIGHKVVTKVNKASPELLIFGGIGCLIGGTVMACKAYGEVKDILDESDKKISDLEAQKNEPGELTEKEIKQEINKTRIKSAGKIIRKTGPALAVIGGGAYMVLKSHSIMKDRNAKLLGAYNAVSSMFQAYRSRVLEESDGIERDNKYSSPEDAEWTEDSEDQMLRETNNKAMSMARGHSFNSMYKFEFSKYTALPQWNRNEMICLSNIRSAEDNLNLKYNFRENGDPITLAEALRECGLNPSWYPWSYYCGWRNDGTGDDHIVIHAENVGNGVYTIEFNCNGELFK